MFAAVTLLLPGLGGSHARSPVDPAALPWSALGRVQIPDLGRCTGALVAPQRVATAAHCLYSRRLGHSVPPSAIHVLMGYDAGHYASHSLVVSYEIAPGADVAVLRLAAPLQAPMLGLAPTEPAPGTGLMLGGYDQDRAERLTADLACAATGAVQDAGGRRMLGHDCAGTLGTSGAPLLQRLPGGAWAIAGIQVAARRGASGGLAVPVQVLRDLLDGS